MDKNLKIMLSNLFDNYCFTLTETGVVIPTYFLVKNKIITMMNNYKTHFSQYTNTAIEQAEKQDADALVLIAENKVIVGKKEDPTINAAAKGLLKIGDYPNSKQYLVLYYMPKVGVKEALFGEVNLDPSGIKFVRENEWVNEITI